MEIVIGSMSLHPLEINVQTPIPTTAKGEIRPESSRRIHRPSFCDDHVIHKIDPCPGLPFLMAIIEKTAL